MIFSDSFCKEVKSMWVQKGIEMDESAYLLHTMLKILTAILWFTKGQLISKQNCQAITSSKNKHWISTSKFTISRLIQEDRLCFVLTLK